MDNRCKTAQECTDPDTCVGTHQCVKATGALSAGEQSAYARQQLQQMSDRELLGICGNILENNQAIRAVHFRSANEGPDDMGQAEFHAATEEIALVIEEVKHRVVK